MWFTNTELFQVKPGLQGGGFPNVLPRQAPSRISCSLVVRFWPSQPHLCFVFSGGACVSGCFEGLLDRHKALLNCHRPPRILTAHPPKYKPPPQLSQALIPNCHSAPPEAVTGPPSMVTCPFFELSQAVTGTRPQLSQCAPGAIVTGPPPLLNYHMPSPIFSRTPPNCQRAPPEGCHTHPNCHQPPSIVTGPFANCHNLAPEIVTSPSTNRATQ